MELQIVLVGRVCAEARERISASSASLFVSSSSVAHLSRSLFLAAVHVSVTNRAMRVRTATGSFIRSMLHFLPTVQVQIK